MNPIGLKRRAQLVCGYLLVVVATGCAIAPAWAFGREAFGPWEAVIAVAGSWAYATLFLLYAHRMIVSALVAPEAKP